MMMLFDMLNTFNSQVSFLVLISLWAILVQAHGPHLVVHGQLTVKTGQGNSTSSISTTASPSSSSSNATNASSGGGGGTSQLISKDQFTQAVQGAGYPAAPDGTYEALAQALQASSIRSKRELAMFLAQTMHESVGYSATKETACQTDLAKCQSAYPVTVGDKSKVYYGRGYMQLTWDYNYQDASQAIFGDKQVLLQNPDQVATNLTLAWQASFWFWDTKVHPDAGVQSGCFGSATKVINGGLECKGANQDEKTQREHNYAAVLKAMGLTETPNYTGCTDACSGSSASSGSSGSSASSGPSASSSTSNNPTATTASSSS
jgi:predicted chitinase